VAGTHGWAVADVRVSYGRAYADVVRLRHSTISSPS
jgi:hypothetical protein